MVDCWYIIMDCTMYLIEKFIAFGLYRSSPDPVKCLVEEEESNLGSGDQGISQYWQWNIQFLRFYGGAFEESAKDRV